MSEMVTMSSKGQIVVPKELRKELGLDTGAHFAIFGKEDTLILKKVNVPAAKEVFKKIHKWGVALAKKKGWKEADVTKMIHKGREVAE
jgi:antitoxin PrlF